MDAATGQQLNPKTRRTALYAIAAVAILASLNAMAHSYIGLAGWADEHGQSGWWKWTWPLEIDVFLLAGELALYVAYLDGWPGRAKIWPWTLALVGLGVSVAGNVGHVAPPPGADSARLSDQLTAAAAPVAAFAGLWVGLLTLKESAKHAAPATPSDESNAATPDVSGDRPESDPGLSSGGPESDSGAPTSDPESDPADPTNRDEGEPSDLLAQGVRLDTWHRSEMGRPVSADRLRHELGVGSERARRLVREIRDHAGANGDQTHPGQLELASGGPPH